MLTANGKALCKLNSMDQRSGNTRITFLNTSNTETTRDGAAPSNPGSISYFLNTLILCVGTGSNAPASSDYTMTDIDAGLTVLNRTREGSNGDYHQDYIGIFNTTYRNDTENDIVISEVGIIGSKDSGTDAVLIARDVIDPITIAPGEAYTFTMYIG